MDKWIPVTARLPKTDTEVLVTVCGGDAGNAIDIGEYLGGGVWHCSLFGRDGYVIAWMPSPKAYEPACWDCEYGGEDETLEPGMFGLKCHHKDGKGVVIYLDQSTPHNCPLSTTAKHKCHSDSVEASYTHSNGEDEELPFSDAESQE